MLQLLEESIRKIRNGGLSRDQILDIIEELMVKSGPKTFSERRLESAVIPGVRLPAPEDMEPAAKVFWDAIVVRLPADWFTSETVPLLKAYCRHSAFADQFAKDIAAQRERIAALESEPQTKTSVRLLNRAIEQLHALHRMHAAETACMQSIATKLRLTNQSRYVKETAASKARSTIRSGLQPWHDWGMSSEN